MAQNKSSTLWYVGIAAIGHFTVDAYGNFFAPLLPLLVPKIGLSLVAVGSLASILGLSTSLIQPLFGFWADRMGGRWMIVGSTVLASIFFSLIGFASSYATLALILMLGGIGVAAFHPQAAAMAGKTHSQRRGLGMSIFTTAGTTGFALSPVVVAFVADQFGLENVLWMFIPGFLLSVPFYRYTPLMQTAAEKKTISAVWSDLRQHLLSLTPLAVVVIIRAVVSIGFMTFIPLLLKSRHMSVLAGGRALFFVTTQAMRVGVVG